MARTRGIIAGQARVAIERASHKSAGRGFEPRPAQPAVLCPHWSILDWFVDRRSLQLCSLPRQSSSHIERLLSGSWRAKVYAGKNPLSGREIRFQKTRKTEVEAQIELGRLLELARAGPQPDSDVTVAELLDEYVPIAGWDVSTLETNLGYIRRTIKPALGAREVRKVRGPLLDNLYARLQQCGNLACAGKPFTEHRHVPDLRPDVGDGRAEWEEAAGRLREAVTGGALVRGDALPSVPEIGRLQGLKPGTLKHVFRVLEAEGLLVIRHGRTRQVAGEPPGISDRPRGTGRPGHARAMTATPDEIRNWQAAKA